MRSMPLRPDDGHYGVVTIAPHTQSPARSTSRQWEGARQIAAGEISVHLQRGEDEPQEDTERAGRRYGGGPAAHHRRGQEGGPA